MLSKPQAEILIWTASLQRDEAHMHLVGGFHRQLLSVTVESEPPVEVGTAYNLTDKGSEILCTVAIDQDEWRKCYSSFQAGVAVYAGPFKIIGGLV